jgi:hypothetical protein
MAVIGGDRHYGRASNRGAMSHLGLQQWHGPSAYACTRETDGMLRLHILPSRDVSWRE